MTNQAAPIQEPYERRALLLHLGDVLETVFCLSQCADEYASIGDAVRGNDALAGFTLLGFVDARMSPREFIRRASGAFFVWPKALLDESLNRPMLANTVKHDLFEDNPTGWRAYVEERRAEVPWFGEDLPDRRKRGARACSPRGRAEAKERGRAEAEKRDAKAVSLSHVALAEQDDVSAARVLRTIRASCPCCPRPYRSRGRSGASAAALFPPTSCPAAFSARRSRAQPRRPAA